VNYEDVQVDEGQQDHNSNDNDQSDDEDDEDDNTLSEGPFLARVSELGTACTIRQDLKAILAMHKDDGCQGSSSIRETHWCGLFTLPIARARFGMPSFWSYQQ